MKKIITLFLTVLLVFSTLFVVNNKVFADDGSDEEGTVEVSDPVEEDGEEVNDEIPPQENDDPGEDEELPEVPEELSDEDVLPGEEVSDQEEDPDEPTEEETLPEESDEEEVLPEAGDETRATGTAYAVLTEEGELIFFRSEETYEAGPDQTVKDINGTEYAGEVFVNVENYDKPFMGKASIRKVRVANGQSVTVGTGHYYFQGCTGLTEANLNGFGVANGYYSYFFDGCSNLVSVDLSVNGDEITYIQNLFNGCSSLKNVIFFPEGIVTASVHNFDNIFNGCSSLEEIDISCLNTRTANNMSNVFSGCGRLKKVKIGVNLVPWWSGAYLPAGYWQKEGTDLILKPAELAAAYAEDPSAYAGTWIKTEGEAYAVLLSDGSLVFTRSFEEHEDGVSGTLTDLNGHTYEGVIFAGVENTSPGDDYMSWGTYKESIKRAYAVDVIRPKYMRNWFRECTAMESFDGTNFDTSDTFSMTQLFLDCSKLTDIDLSGFRTGSLEQMAGMFRGCSKLTEVDISNFDTSNVVNMDQLFYQCSALTSFNMNGLDTSKVNVVSSMFAECGSIRRIDLSGLDLSSVTYMTYMFEECSSLEYLDVSGISTANVAGMDHLFWKCDSLMSIKLGTGWTQWIGESLLPSGDWKNGSGLSKTNAELKSEYPDHAAEWAGLWSREQIYAVLSTAGDLVFVRSGEGHPNASTGTVTDVRGNTHEGIIFSGVEASSRVRWDDYKDQIKTVRAIDTVKPMSMLAWFSGCANLVSFDGMNFDTSDVTTMYQLFNNCESVTSIVNLRYFDTSNVENMAYMFFNCGSLTDLDVTGFNTVKVENMKYMFGKCGSLTYLDVTHFDTPEVQDIEGMFYACGSLTSLDLSHFNTSKMTRMHGVFLECEKLESLNLNGFDTKNVTDMSYMFDSCRLLDPLDLSSFDTSNVTSMAYMFANCNSLTSLDISGFNTEKVTAMYGMFVGCDKLSTVVLGKGLTRWIDYATLPTGNWYSERKEITLNEQELYLKYPSNASKWYGTWRKISDVAVLKDDGDLVFTRAFGSYENDTHDVVTDRKGNVLEGRVFTAFNKSSSYVEAPWKPYGTQIRRVYAIDTIKVRTLDSWFANCYGLEEFDGANFDTSKVTEMDYMFANCSHLMRADLSGFDTSKVEQLYRMFSECTSLTELDLSGFQTPNLRELYEMFYDCVSLTSLDLGGIDTSNVTNFGSLFYNCANLKSLDLSGFDTSSALNMANMFTGCNALESVTFGPGWIRWYNNSCLPNGTWTDGRLYLGQDELYQLMNDEPGQHFGTWQKVGDIYERWGEILFEDRPVSIEDVPTGLWISKLDDTKTYTGKAITQEFRVYDHKKLLTAGKDYTFKYSNNVNTGTATLTVTGKGSYVGTLSKEFAIQPMQLDSSHMTIKLDKKMFRYDGKAHKPKVSVAIDGKSVKAKEYTLAYYQDGSTPVDEPVEVAYYGVAVIMKSSNYNCIPYAYFEIVDGTPVEDLGLKLEYTKTAYDGSAKNPALIIPDGVDDSLLHWYPYENVLPGTAGVRVFGDDVTYFGMIELPFTITGTALSKAKISGFKSTIDYTGSPVSQPGEFKLTYNGSDLTEGTDYSVDYQNNTDAGTATMILTGMNGYTGTLKKTFKIKGKTFSAKTIGFNNFFESIDYNGTPRVQEHAELFEKGGGSLIENVDYTATYKNNVNAGTASVTYKGVRGYEGSFTKTYKIKKAVLNDSNVDLEGSYAYVKGGAKPQPVVSYGGETHVLNKDYTLTYKNNTKAGKTATVTVKGKGNYSGTINRTFQVTVHRLAGLTMTAADKAYSAKPKAMSTTVTITDSNGKKLSAGTDYEKKVEYTNAETGAAIPVAEIPVGTLIKATVTLKGNYSGKISNVFRIVAGDISKAKVSIPSQYYTGGPVILNKTDIKITLNKTVLDAGHYEIVSYRNNIAKGTATVVLRGVGNYGGTKTATFKIAQRSMGITVRFHANGGTGTMKDLRVYKNTALTANAFKYAGKHFLVWLDPVKGFSFSDKEKIYSWYEPGDVVDLNALWN